MSFSSFPDIFYLSPDHASSFQNARLISREGACLGSHQALLGASCRNLKKCLLDPRLILETEAVILCPDYSREDLDQFLQVLYGNASAKESSPVVKSLLGICDFITEPVEPAGSIANIKSEIVIPDESEVDELAPRKKRKRASNGELPSFPCDFCPEVYKYQARYETHLFNVHGVEDPDTAEQNCEKCGKSVLLKKMKKHLQRRCQGNREKKVKKVVPDIKVKQEIEDDSTNLMEPKVDLTELLDPEEDLKCSSCDEVLKRKDMGDHLQNIHGVTPSFPCNGCEKIFALDTELRYHWMEAHAPSADGPTKKPVVKSEPVENDDNWSDDHLSDFVVDEDDFDGRSTSTSSESSSTESSDDEEYNGGGKRRKGQVKGKKRGPKPGSKRRTLPKLEPIIDPNQPGKLICPTDGCDVAKDTK